MNSACTNGCEPSPGAATDERRDSKDPAPRSEAPSGDIMPSQTSDMAPESEITPTSPVTDRDPSAIPTLSQDEKAASKSETAAEDPATLWDSVAPEYSETVPAAGKGLPPRLSDLYTYRSFGHPHATLHHSVITSYSEPFSQQYPKWATPGNRLQYDASRGKFSYRLSAPHASPYNETTLRARPAGYFKGDTRSVPAPSSSVRYVSADPVEIYIGETFVQNIPLRLLLRFSTAARRLFKHQRPRARYTAHHSIQPSLSRTPSEPNRGMSHSPAHSLQAGTSAASTTKQMILDLDAPRLPSTKAIRSIIEWMQIVEPTPPKTWLPAFAPANFSTIPDKDLIDLYSAVLVFELQPRSVWQNLADELGLRISIGKPSVKLLKKLRLSLPICDLIMTQALVAVVEHRQRGAYLSGGGWDKMREFLFESGDEVLAAKAEEMLARYDGQYAQVLNERQFSGDVRVKDGERIAGSGESDDVNDHGIPERRRRKRRAQQLRGGQTERDRLSGSV
ncbi:hypothetical protein CERZMDRAFT_102935 [Cercospora zeae-maydis SCOH1-5]|uniref:Uncharacterized protein n=1 Tax=Cercospora zeae-maydis SCOH1-5 TaxID=717836 RepID=A0A6A6EZK6_9PEZI|nr:hypothetical protein CERZMDRAFT_102935 [Cercospora zeae-maydis SCOH1-5]